MTKLEDEFEFDELDDLIDSVREEEKENRSYKKVKMEKLVGNSKESCEDIATQNLIAQMLAEEEVAYSQFDSENSEEELSYYTMNNQYHDNGYDSMTSSDSDGDEIKQDENKVIDEDEGKIFEYYSDDEISEDDEEDKNYSQYSVVTKLDSFLEPSKKQNFEEKTAKKTKGEVDSYGFRKGQKHHTRWSKEEDDKLLEAMSIYKYSNWDVISEYIGTRTAMQCKNRNGYLNSILNENTPAKQKPKPDVHLSIHATKPFLSCPLPDNFSSIQTFKKPQDFAISKEKVHPFEVYHNCEWFPDLEHPFYQHKRFNINKIPSRYIKIRNHILDLWESQRPKFVSKTSIRKGLKGEGDVHALSRVWEFLDRNSLINIGVSNAKKGKHAIDEPCIVKDEQADELIKNKSIRNPLPPVYFKSDQKRKRRVRDENGEWIDESELEGRVIDHAALEAELEQKKKRQMRRKLYRNGELSYDPFRLIAPKKYSGLHQPPFQVSMTCDALAIMDFHSHLAYTEVIGLLGGKLDIVNKELLIESAHPCKSISTTMQCEMDPISEMNARDYFLEQGLMIVGWYHSHPTFDPNPSVRDIETQCTYQSIFKTKEGLEPFVGVIINPYPQECPSEISEIKVLYMSNEKDESHSLRSPYTCLWSLCEPILSNPDKVEGRLKKLMIDYMSHDHKINLSEIYMIEEDSDSEEQKGSQQRQNDHANNTIDHDIMQTIQFEPSPPPSSITTTFSNTISKLDKTLVSVQSHLNGFMEENVLNGMMGRLRLTYTSNQSNLNKNN